MHLVSRLKNAWGALRADSGGGLSPLDDRFFQTSSGIKTATGLRVSPDSALRVAAVFACVRVVAETVASLPLIVYKRRQDGGKERALSHPLYKVLHDSPNPWQTAFEWVEMMQSHLELRGNAYSIIISGNGRVIDQLWPVHPDRVRVFRLSNGRLRYEITSLSTGQTDSYRQDQILHLKDRTFNGLTGLSTISAGAEVIGSALAAQEFSERFFQNDATPSGVLKHPKTLSKGAYDRIKTSWHEAHNGANAHSIAITEEGMEYQNIGISNRDSQLLEARQFSRGDIASLWRVPPHKIGDLTRATFSNIEQQNIEFATDCIRPRLVRFERRICMDLIDPLQYQGGDDEYFCEFLMDALLRGDLKSRYESYFRGRQGGWLSANDVRNMENMNPIANGDVYLTPLNMVPAGSDESTSNQDDAANQEDGNAIGGKARLKDFVNAAAERVVRKEVKALERLMTQSADDLPKLTREIIQFYGDHAGFVQASMRLTAKSVKTYVQGHIEILNKFTREEALRMIAEVGPDALASLALGENQ